MSTLRVGMLSFAHSTHPERYLSALVRHPDVEVVGVWDDHPERAAHHAAGHGVPMIDDFDEFLEECDAVVISSEYSRHLEHIRAAVSRGLAVLCEKPLSSKAAEIAEIRDLVARAATPFMVALPCRYLAPVRRARELVLGGAIGELVAISATNRGACPGGWFVDATISGGGAIMDHSAHMADLMRWITGSEFETVHAAAGSRLHSLEVEDTGMLQLRMSNGVIASLDTSWSRRAPLPATFDVTLRLVGTEGTISVDALAQRVDVYADEVEWNVYSGSMDDAMIDAFVRMVIDGTESPISVDDGFAASLVAPTAYRSLLSAAPVPVA